MSFVVTTEKRLTSNVEISTQTDKLLKRRTIKGFEYFSFEY